MPQHRVSFVNIPLPSDQHHISDPHLRSTSEGSGILTEPTLCYGTVYYYKVAQCYEQFLQVSRLV